MALASETGAFGKPCEVRQMVGQSRNTCFPAAFPAARGGDTHLGTGVPAPHQQGGDGLGDGVPNGWADVVVRHVRCCCRCKQTAHRNPLALRRHTCSQENTTYFLLKYIPAGTEMPNH